MTTIRVATDAKESMAYHRKSHLECTHDLDMPPEYFKDSLSPQLCSLCEEDSLKDMTINLRTSKITMSSFMLSLLSPVLRTMACGNFRESICKEISLDDVDEERLLKLLGLGCGKKGIVAEGIEELLGLGELAECLQMTAVRIEVENELFKEVRMENCLEMIEQSEARGLELLQKECYKMLRDKFGVISQKEGFVKLSEETIWALLEEDELGVSREEDVFKAILGWMSNCDEGMRGAGMLRKIRYGVMSKEYLAEHIGTALPPGHGTVKELVGEMMAKKGSLGGEGMWDGVERLCDNWMVARGMKGRIIGADVLKNPKYVAMDGQGRIVVSDPGLGEVIVFNHNGSVARRFGSQGGTFGRFYEPMGVAVDGKGHIVVVDYGRNRIQMLNVDGSVARCFGSKGSAVGQLKRPYGVAIDSQGHIVIADRGNHRIQVFDADGSVVRHFGSSGAAIGQLQGPRGVAVDGAGRIVVADEYNHRVQVFNCDGSVALCFGSMRRGPGQLMWPHDVAVDSAGRFIVTDIKDRVHVFNSDGSVARVMGSAGDGVGELIHPGGIAVDRGGRILITEGLANHRVQVW